MSTAPATAKTTAAKNTTPPPPDEWTQIPPAPKTPNFWQGHGHTLHYGSPGWDVHEGTHSSKDTLGDVLFHSRTAAEAKAWVVEQAPAKSAKPAAKAPAAKAEPAAKPAAPKPRAPRKAAAKAQPAARAEQPAELPDAESNAHVLDGVTTK